MGLETCRKVPCQALTKHQAKQVSEHGCVAGTCHQGHHDALLTRQSTHSCPVVRSGAEPYRRQCSQPYQHQVSSRQERTSTARRSPRRRWQCCNLDRAARTSARHLGPSHPRRAVRIRDRQHVATVQIGTVNVLYVLCASCCICICLLCMTMLRMKEITLLRLKRLHSYRAVKDR